MNGRHKLCGIPVRLLAFRRAVSAQSTFAAALDSAWLATLPTLVTVLLLTFCMGTLQATKVAQDE